MLDRLPLPMSKGLGSLVQVFIEKESKSRLTACGCRTRLNVRASRKFLTSRDRPPSKTNCFIYAGQGFYLIMLNGYASESWPCIIKVLRYCLLTYAKIINSFGTSHRKKKALYLWRGKGWRLTWLRQAAERL
jgi:hypothetical protein